MCRIGRSSGPRGGGAVEGDGTQKMGGLDRSGPKHDIGDIAVELMAI
jgi:hypothetical protein